MGQHYIPQYYLDGFTDTSSRIYQYEKDSNYILSTSTKSVANENRRWSPKTEDYLTNQIENPANPIIAKIRDRNAITQSEKEILSAYMVTLWNRVPKGWERTKGYVPRFFDALDDHILKLMEDHPEKITILQNRRQELKNLRPKYENEFPREIWYESLRPDITPRTVATLPIMTWTFLTSDKGQPFLTNDNPVFTILNLRLYAAAACFAAM